MIVGLLFAKGNEICYTSVFVILKVEAQYLIDGITRFEAFGIYRQNARIGGTKLCIKIYSDRDALDLSNALCQLVKLLI